MLKMILPSAFMLLTLQAQAQVFSLSNLMSTDAADRATISVNCTGKPGVDKVLECRLVQQTIQGGLTKEEIDKRKAQAAAAFEDGKQVRKIRQWCSDQNKQKITERRERFPVMATVIPDWREGCDAEARDALQALAAKKIEAEISTCMIMPPAEWKTRFVRSGPVGYRSEPVAGQDCGSVIVETLESRIDNPQSWTYRRNVANFDRASAACASRPAQLEKIYRSDGSAEFPIKCTSVKFGATR